MPKVKRVLPSTKKLVFLLGGPSEGYIRSWEGNAEELGMRDTGLQFIQKDTVIHSR